MSGNTLSRMVRGVAAVLGFSLATAAAAASGPISPSAAPAEWVRYAEGAGEQVKAALDGGDEAALRLRAYLQASAGGSAQGTRTLPLKIWVSPDGAISRVEFPPFLHDQANADLRQLLVGRKLAGNPPADMRLPMNIHVDLEPAPANSSRELMGKPPEQPARF